MFAVNKMQTTKTHYKKLTVLDLHLLWGIAQLGVNSLAEYEVALNLKRSTYFHGLLPNSVHAILGNDKKALSIQLKYPF